MRHQIRLLDQNLPGLTRELALACWREVEARVPEVPGASLYRSLYRAVRGVFQAEVQAFRFCGATLGCENSLEPRELVRTFPHELYPGERIHVYIVGAETSPELLVRKLVEQTARAVVRRFPHRLLPGLTRFLKERIGKVMYGRIFTSARCGETPLCSMNEAVDPWDAADPANRIQKTVARSR